MQSRRFLCLGVLFALRAGGQAFGGATALSEPLRLTPAWDTPGMTPLVNPGLHWNAGAGPTLQLDAPSLIPSLPAVVPALLPQKPILIQARQRPIPVMETLRVTAKELNGAHASKTGQAVLGTLFENSDTPASSPGAVEARADLPEPRLPPDYQPHPITVQKKDYSCGPAAALSVLRYRRAYKGDEKSLYALFDARPKDGTPPQNIAKGLTQLGLKTELREGMSLDDLRAALRRGDSVILDIQAWRDDANTPWSQRWEDGHYVVLTGMDENYAYLMDPSMPKRYAFLPLPQLMERWHDYDDRDGPPRRFYQLGIMVSGGKPRPRPTKPPAPPGPIMLWPRAAGQTAMTDAPERLRRITDEYLAELPAVDPDEASYLGLYQNSGALTAYDERSLRQRQAFARRHLKALESLSPGSLGPEEAVDRLLLMHQLKKKVEESSPDSDFGVSTFLTEPLDAITRPLLKPSAPSTLSERSAVSLIESYPAVLRAGRRLIKNPAKIEIDAALRDLPGAKQFLAEAGFNLQRMLPGERGRIERAVMNACRELDRFEIFLKALRPKAKGRWASGRQGLRDSLREHFLAQDEKTLRVQALRTARETLAQLQAAAEELYPGMDWRQALDAMGKQHLSLNEVLGAYERSVQRAREHVVGKGLMSLPEVEQVRVLRTPEFLRTLLPEAAYEGPAPLGHSKEGQVFVTLPPTGASPKKIEAWLAEYGDAQAINLTAAHEAIPGHHLQNVRQNAHPRLMHRIYWDEFFGEGWAHYIEGLMLDTGFFTPQGRLVVLYERYWQAVRARVSLGLHAEGWSLDRAASYFQKKLMLTKERAAAAMRQYALVDPVEDISYSLGRVEILRIKEKLRARLGPRFNEKEFHDRLLSYGGIPLPLIEQALERDWR